MDMDTSKASTPEESNDAQYRLHGLPLAGVVVALFLALLMAALDGTIVDTATPRIIGRYQIIAIIGAIILVVGVFFMTQMNAATSSLEITGDVFLIGIGLGILIPLTNVSTQNALPKNLLGVGIGAVTFLRSMGSTLATAILGTIVNTVSSREIMLHLPITAHRFSDAYLKAATEKQVLTSAVYRHTIIQQGISATVKAASVPSGPHQNSTIAALTQQTTLLLNHLFQVVRESLATGIHQAFVVAFCLCLVILVITFFLKDTPALQE